jgi:hypothetical protein
MRKLTEKYNDSCVTIFELLKLLSGGQADYKDVLTLFSDKMTEGKSNPHVILNKYLNTLKIFGIKVKKNNNKYYLLNSPFKIDLAADDLRIINMLKESLQVLHGGKTRKNFEAFLEALEFRYNDNTQDMAQSMEKSNGFTFGFTELKEQVDICEKYCEQKHKLKVTYMNRNSEIVDITCSPVELAYNKRKICLKVYNQSSAHIVEIPLENIRHVEQLPQMVSSAGTSGATTVLFRITGRLAKSYKLKENERLNTTEEDGSLVIANQGECLETLLQRLMRYEENCVILSPKPVRESMRKLIEETIEQYEEVKV